MNNKMDIVRGKTWARQFYFTQTLADGSAATVGAPGWGAEFALFDTQNPNLVLAVASVANNKAAWTADGILWVSFSQSETLTFDFDRAAWCVDLIVPNTSLDPLGYREGVLSGELRVQARAGGQPNRAFTQTRL